MQQQQVGMVGKYSMARWAVSSDNRTEFNIPSMNFLFLEGMLLVALHPKCSASGSEASLLFELILQHTDRKT